jgi:hypothetical protein
VKTALPEDVRLYWVNETPRNQDPDTDEVFIITPATGAGAIAALAENVSTKDFSTVWAFRPRPGSGGYACDSTSLYARCEVARSERGLSIMGISDKSSALPQTQVRLYET